jgi:hypothetical protein
MKVVRRIDLLLQSPLVLFRLDEFTNVDDGCQEVFEKDWTAGELQIGVESFESVRRAAIAY